MIAGCYSIDVYCSNSKEASECGRFVCATGDSYNSKGASTTASGETLGECIKQVKARGWKIDKKNDRHFCPKCVAAKLVW